MPPRTKRPLDVIDLTATDNDGGYLSSDPFEPPQKQPRLSGGASSVSSRYSSSSAGPSSSSHLSASLPSSSRTSLSSSSQNRLSSQTDIYGDDGEELDLTQRDDGPKLDLYGTMNTKIVGCQYYQGYATMGETVMCRREPQNAYDRNAIRVDNVAGSQIGHIPRKVAEKLAPYMDRNTIVVEGELAGVKGAFDCPIKLSFYGSLDRYSRPYVENRLKEDKLVKASELKQIKKANDLRREREKAAMGLKSGLSTVGLGGNKSGSVAEEPEISMDELLQISQAINVRSGEDIAKTLAMDEEQLSKMPKAYQPDELRAKLLPYQLQGLAWLRAKETPSFPAPGSPSAVQLWKRDARGRYANVATNFTVQQAPRLLKGGILADDMGLGKTLQVISLIVTGGHGPTLIVAPVTVMSNWQQQVERHVHGDQAPRVLVYYGSQRRTSAEEVQKYGIVITSYGTMTSEFKDFKDGGKSALFSINWRRVVLDEGHTIRNARTKTAEAACGLQAEARWVLTGTPIINNIKDLHSLLKFLRITGGIENMEIFNAVIARGLESGTPRAEALLQSLMHDLCLRRNKDMKFVDLKLPPKTEYVHRITFSPDERKKYDTLLAEAIGALEKYQNRSKFGQEGRFQNVLERLLRLRQTCCHWTLCRQRHDDLLKLLDDQAVVELNPKNRAILQEALRFFIESQEDCCVCLDSLTNPVITHCKHVFCRNCITTVIQTQHKCPMCRMQLAEENLLEPAPETDGSLEGEDDDASSAMDKKSSKTEALLKILQATLKNPGSKVVIFSQWTSFLTVIQRQLEEMDYTFTRVDGSMRAAERDVAIHALDHDPKVRIMLASLGVCSVGLNLVSADTVVLADSWWAPAIEDQAVDRVHRLGQTRPTTVWRLVMEDSVEERVLDIQAKKRELVSKAFRDKGKKVAKETRTADIVTLLR